MTHCVDWSSLDSHDEIDALLTERNAAQAEAKLWLRRLQDAQRERDQARADLRQAEENIDSWEKAYADLLRDFRRLEVRFDHLCADDENRRWLLEHLDPFLPESMQAPELRAKAPVLYAQIARWSKEVDAA